MIAATTTSTPEAKAAAPERAVVVRTEVRDDGVAVLTLDDPREVHSTITPELGEQLVRALDTLEADGRVKAIVVRGKESSFLAGANIAYLQTIRFAADATDAARELARRFARLSAGDKPVVACVHGPALGGGMELSLACTAAVATSDARTVLGLPEVKLGLMPAANGLLRVAERAGLRVAIDLGLSGRSLRPKRALALGLIDEVVAPAAALDAAAALARRIAAAPQRARRALAAARAQRARGGALGLARAKHALLEQNPIGRAVLFRRARAEARARARGHYPAVERMLDVVERWARRGFGPAAELEARLFGELVVSETSHRLVELFFATTAVKKDTGLAAGEVAEPAKVERVAVLGAGLMGAGIACVTVDAGLPVRMKDRDDLALGRGLKYVRHHLDARVRRGTISEIERSRAMARLSGAIDYSGLRHVDVVVEAVFEDLALKRAVLREVEGRVSASCVIASNTSSLPIASVAAEARHPERVVGMHYFSPVPKMPLLEVVRARATDARTVATAVALGRRQGKTVIVVGDGPGFFTTRILAPYLNEAAQLLAEGVAIEAIDHALVDWGFPVGPMRLLDEVGIDVAAHVAKVLVGALGERMRPPPALDALDADHRQGRKNGRGFYMAGRGPRRVDDTVYGVVGVAPGSARPLADEISLRCALAMVNEAARCVDEGILRSPRDGDLGAILGVGFPAFRGGPLRYVDVLGAEEILRRTRSLEQRFGPRFTPAPLLVEMARKARRFYG